ncbi:hypothetical protein KA183_19445 [bacterium]|nr:hypothetical protein [bacterium]QQR58206.1 MAG: hypothetical protein IPG59_01575 [Candidatus Melainabacteria bacterium]
MQNSIQTKVEFKLGEVMVAFGILSAEELQRGLKLSSITGLPLGKTLIFLEYIHEQLLRDLVEAQSMLRDNVVSVEEVRSAINVVKISNLRFGEALFHLGIKPTGASSRLGELLSEANKINSKQLKIGLQVADHSGLPLGQVLVMLNVISDDCLRVTLALQRQLRTGEIVMHTATSKIKSMRQADITSAHLPCAPQATPSSESRPKTLLGDLLVQAEIISQLDLSRALINHRKSGNPIGQHLIEASVISSELLGLALRLQILISHDKVTEAEAIKILKEIQCHATQTNSIKFGDDDSTDFSFQDFLRTSNYLTWNKKKEVVKRLLQMPTLLCSVLRTLNVMPGQSVEQATLIEDAFKNDCLLRSILFETHRVERTFVESAFVYYTLMKNEKMGFNEAIMNFVIKSKGLELAHCLTA